MDQARLTTDGIHFDNMEGQAWLNRVFHETDSFSFVNSAKIKRVEEVMDLGQGDYQLPGTDRMLTDVAMVPHMLMAGIKSTGYKSKRSDRTLTGATLEMEKLSQCGESTMKDFKPSPMIHGKGSVTGQLETVEYNRWIHGDVGIPKLG